MTAFEKKDKRRKNFGRNSEVVVLLRRVAAQAKDTETKILGTTLLVVTQVVDMGKVALNRLLMNLVVVILGGTAVRKVEREVLGHRRLQRLRRSPIVSPKNPRKRRSRWLQKCRSPLLLLVRVVAMRSVHMRRAIDLDHISLFSFVEVDLFTFDDPAPAPAPAAATNDDFGAFQATPAPAAADDDDFGAFVASKSASQPDPFAAPASQPPAPVASFDAFGNAAPVMQAAAPMAQNNNMMTASMNNAFGNMSLGQTQQQQAPMVAGGGANDDFGDFTAAGPKSLASATASNPGDPMSKLVSLDGLSKNPRNPGEYTRAFFSLSPLLHGTLSSLSRLSHG